MLRKISTKRQNKIEDQTVIYLGESFSDPARVDGVTSKCRIQFPYIQEVKTHCSGLKSDGYGQHGISGANRFLFIICLHLFQVLYKLSHEDE